MTTATLKWTDPSKRTYGSALASSDIAGVDIVDTHTDGSTEVLGTVLAGVQTFTTGVLSVGDHAFTAVVKDTSGHSSASSNVAAVTVVATLANPEAITDLSVVLNS